MAASLVPTVLYAEPVAWPSIVGIGLWFASGAAVGVSMVRAELAYYRLYEMVRGVDLGVPRGPLEIFQPGTSLQRLWDIVQEPQQDPVLEQVRQRVRRRWRLALAVVFLGPIIIVALSYL